MSSVSILCGCGFIQILCAVSFLFFKIFEQFAIAIVLYALTGIILLCLSCHQKNIFLVLSANIFTLLSLFASSGLAVFALVPIFSDQYKKADIQQTSALLAISLVMLFVTLASMMKICRLWFCSRDAAIDSSSLTKIHVRVRDNGGPTGVSSTPTSSTPTRVSSTIQVEDERNAQSASQPGSEEDDLFQHLITDGSEEEQTEDFYLLCVCID